MARHLTAGYLALNQWMRVRFLPGQSIQGDNMTYLMRLYKWVLSIPSPFDSSPQATQEPVEEGIECKAPENEDVLSTDIVGGPPVQPTKFITDIKNWGTLENPYIKKQAMVMVELTLLGSLLKQYFDSEDDITLDSLHIYRTNFEKTFDQILTKSLALSQEIREDSDYDLPSRMKLISRFWSMISEVTKPYFTYHEMFIDYHKKMSFLKDLAVAFNKNATPENVVEISEKYSFTDFKRLSSFQTKENSDKENSDKENEPDDLED